MAMGGRLQIFFGVLLLVYVSQTQAQVQFSACPQNYALIPRDIKTNQAEIKIAGNALNGKYTTAQFSTYQNGNLINARTVTLTYSGGLAPFDYRIKLKAGKYHYTFKIDFTGSSNLSQTINDVVIGDVFLIQGQSNAVANSYYGLVKPKYADSFIRSFGSSTYDPTGAYNDTFWHIADGDNYYNSGCIGQWGMVLARSILDSFGIPVAILNGAVGGTPITYHQRYSIDPENIYTCYGRLLYRARKGGLSKNIRSILYFQGESDGPQPKVHDSLFRTLYTDWFKDYSGINQNYLVQVRGNGCGGVTAQLCEYQRKFEFTLQKLKVISSNGLNGHDGCHYYMVNGYELLGKQLAALTARDLYGSARKTNIDPPNILSAYYSNESHSEITLNMRQPNDSIFVDANFHILFYLTGDNTVTITGGSVIKNRVVLKLNKGTCNPLYLTYMGNVGNQPWVKNSTKAGLVGFDKIPVQKPIIKNIYTGCPGKDFYMGEDSIPGYTYKWIRKSDGSIKNTAKVKINATKGEAYTAIMYYKNLSCSSDTFAVFTSIDQTSAPQLGRDTTLCNGDSLQLLIPTNIYAQINWKQNQLSVNGNSFITPYAGKIMVTTTSNLGCVFKDTLEVKTASAQVDLQGPYAVCPGKDTLVSVANNFNFYTWNGIKSTSPTFRSKAGKINITVINADGCTATDSTEIIEFTPRVKPKINVRLCPYDSVQISIPTGFTAWYQNETLLPNWVYINAKSGNFFALQDSNNCVQNDTISIVEKPLPVFSLGPDTSVCPGNKAQFVCPYPVQIYEWNGTRTTAAKYTTTQPGIISCKVQNSEGCIYTDTVQLHLYKIPSISVPTDTTLCEGDVWKPMLNKDYSWTLNGVNKSNIAISSAGIYVFGAIDSHGCEATKNCNVYTQKCVNSVKITQNFVRVFPNPCNDYIRVETHENLPLPYTITDVYGRIIRAANWNANKQIDVSILPPGMYCIQAGKWIIPFIKL